MNEEIQKYRQHLVLAEQKAQETYDKTVLTLSGGALGISMAFLDKVINDCEVSVLYCLATAWSFWGISVATCLISHFFSQRALRHAISQVDSSTIQKQIPGGIFTKITVFCNISSGILFLVGLVFMIIFVYINIGGIRNG